MAFDLSKFAQHMASKKSLDSGKTVEDNPHMKNVPEKKRFKRIAPEPIAPRVNPVVYHGVNDTEAPRAATNVTTTLYNRSDDFATSGKYKLWTIIVTWGREGAKQQSTVKSFHNAHQATAYYLKTLNLKRKSGYRETKW